jgi:hypothetical protein
VKRTVLTCLKLDPDLWYLPSPVFAVRSLAFHVQSVLKHWTWQLATFVVHLSQCCVSMLAESQEFTSLPCVTLPPSQDSQNFSPKRSL